MKIVRRILLGLVLLFIALLILFCFSYCFLSIHKPIESKNLLVESWLIGLGVENLVKEYDLDDIENIYIVGYNHVPVLLGNLYLNNYKAEEFIGWKKRKGALLLTNSSLLVDLTKLDLSKNDSIQCIAIQASDTRLNRIQAHFLVSLDGKFLGDAFVSDSLQDYSFSFDLQMTDPQMLAVCFDNDCYIDGENRNLFVQSIRINETKFEVSESFCLITCEENRITIGFDSQAEKTAQYVRSLSGSNNMLKLITFDPVERNQTLASAIAASAYLNSENIKNLNIASSGMHSRRSLVTYRKVLDPSIKIGVINTQASLYNKDNWYKTADGRKTMINELFSYVISWLEVTF